MDNSSQLMSIRSVIDEDVRTLVKNSRTTHKLFNDHLEKEFISGFKQAQDRWRVIRMVYEIMLPALIKSYPKFDPYIVDWPRILTPIESNVWHDLRKHGLPFLPQFPIGQYFADFADPLKKIAIEVDGKIHDSRIEKDKTREDEIKMMGWKVIRLKGQNTHYDLESYEDQEDTFLPELKFTIDGKTYDGSSEKAILVIKNLFYKEMCA